MRAGTRIWALAVGQTVTYAGLYYCFAALLPALETAFGWTKAQLAAGPTLAFLVTALGTPLTGRLVDRGFGPLLLTALPALGAAALAGMAVAQAHWHWLALWALVGVAQSGCLYETCFAVLIRDCGAEARPSITRITLVAGLASTLAFPLGHALSGAFGGRGALVGFAVLLLLGALPAHLYGTQGLGAGGVVPARSGNLGRALRQPAFWGMAAAFGLTYLNHLTIVTYALVLFGAAGGPAVWAASVIGPSQVLGRLALMAAGLRLNNGMALLMSLGAILLAAVILALSGVAPVLVLLTAALQGAGMGVISILRPVLQAELLGREGFGAISGAIAVAPILATAAAPSLGAILLGMGGPSLLILTCMVLAVAALMLAVWLARLAARA